MSWSDEEIDNLFSDSARDLSFEYKKEYWKDIEAQLPVNKKRDFLWTGTALLFVGALTVSMLGSSTAEKIPGTNAGKDILGFAQERVVRLDDKTPVLHSVAQEKQFNSTEPTEHSAVYESESLTQNDHTQVLPTRLLSAQTGQEKRRTGIISETPAEIGLLSIGTIRHYLNEADIVASVHPKPDYNPFLEFFVQGFGGVNQGRIMPDKGINTSYGIGAGLEFNRRKLHASFAVNGVASNYNSLQFSQRSKVYGFGVQEYNSTVQYSTIYTLESELNVGYRFGRTLVFGGVNMNYLLNTKCSISTEEKDLMTNNLLIQEERNEYGYMDGLYRFNLKPVLGAAYDLSNNLQLGCNIGIQVLNSVDDRYFEGEARELPLDGRIYIRKKF